MTSPVRLPATAVRGGVLLLAAAVAALVAAVLLAGSPASAEGRTATGTLTLLGIRDSNCSIQTGGTTVYVAPGGTLTFRAELTGLSIDVGSLLGINIGTIPISSSLITTFNDKLIINGDTKHPHYVAKGKTFVWHNVGRGTHSLSWSANSITVTVPIINQNVVVPLNANNVGLPVGGHLDWVGKAIASSSTKCGVAIQLPGGGGSVGPISISVAPITNIPTVPVSLPHLPGGGGGGSTTHHPGGGGSSSSGGHGGGGPSNYPTYTSLPTAIPELVVPHPGGGNSAFGGGGGGFGQALPDNGGSIGPLSPGAVTSTAAGSPSASRSGKPVDLANNATDNGLGGAQLPVLLAIVAIIALSLVTAAYARMYLMRRPSA